MKVALVLGGGGTGGWMFHVGVLHALETHAGFRGRDASLAIGTSAGSPIAAMARLGLGADEIESIVSRPPSDAERREYMEVMRTSRRSWKPVAPHLVRSLRTHGPVVAVSGLLPPGIFPTDPLGRMGDLHRTSAWPDGLWIPAVRSDDGAVVVFGRDADVPLSDAIEASSALPLLFQPKTINGHRFLDGGAASPTHADLALDTQPDLVIISSPMSRPVRRPLARFARSRLVEERTLLEGAGIRTVVIEPPAAADRLFREFPRRRWEAGAEILGLARGVASVAAQRALAI
ncbi:MAG: patatin-like phospholipase family protein [Acidimicrobiia bacterium]|nr:patatin-like phospholipase family protein [Acidimicrobiia bacterium]